MSCKPMSHAQWPVSPLVESSQLTTCPCIQHRDILDFAVSCRLFKLETKILRAVARALVECKHTVEPRQLENQSLWAVAPCHGAFWLST